MRGPREAPRAPAARRRLRRHRLRKTSARVVLGSPPGHDRTTGTANRARQSLAARSADPVAADELGPWPVRVSRAASGPAGRRRWIALTRARPESSSRFSWHRQVSPLVPSRRRRGPLRRARSPLRGRCDRLRSRRHRLGVAMHARSPQTPCLDAPRTAKSPWLAVRMADIREVPLRSGADRRCRRGGSSCAGGSGPRRPSAPA